jgi:acyl carrier protein
MVAAHAQKARRVLITTVASYDPKIVNKLAIEDSAEFIKFIEKQVNDGLDDIDYVEIITDLENNLGITIPDEEYKTWQDLFNKIILLLNEE